MICLSLTRDTLASDLALLGEQASFIDAAELRVDSLSPDEHPELASFPERVREEVGRSLPLICSVRRRSEGGDYSGSEADRLKLLVAGVGAGFGFVDLESDLRDGAAGRDVAAQASAAGCEIIRSAHFSGRQPEDVVGVLTDLCAGGSEIARLVVSPGSTRDLLALLEAADETPELRKIIDGQGPFGSVSRILSRRFGSMLTCLTDSDGEPGASGRISPELLCCRYRFREIGSRTRYFSIIGSPIAHSRSPEYHNRRFAEDGLDACYVPFLVDDVAAFFSLAERLPLDGSSVTIPHKEAVLPFMSDVDQGTTAAGACNTVVRTPDGWKGVNTDVPGFLNPLRAVVDPARVKAESPRGIGVTVIGAGGAARAIVYALLREGARVLVLNRSPDRAAALVSDLVSLAGHGDSPTMLSWAPLAPSADLNGFRDAIVQTTSVGMHGDGDPVPWLEFDGSELVYDVVYTPPETPLIVRARRAGCVTVTGDEMFAAQGDEQYRLFSRLARA